MTLRASMPVYHTIHSDILKNKITEITDGSPLTKTHEVAHTISDAIVVSRMHKVETMMASLFVETDSRGGLPALSNENGR